MVENFQKTVNLKGKMKPPATARHERAGKNKKADEIDQIYNDEDGNGSLRKIDKPREKTPNESAFKKIVIFLAFVLIVFIGYSMIFQGGTEKEPAANTSNKEAWYAVKIITGEIYYGQIEDKSTDPVVVKNVYYDYDQDKEKKEGEPSSLRLVKRGKETQGGDGSMNIVRAQVLYMEPLREDSKVFEAILNYEN